jgi:hypothetical protein
VSDLELGVYENQIWIGEFAVKPDQKSSLPVESASFRVKPTAEPKPIALKITAFRAELIIFARFPFALRKPFAKYVAKATFLTFIPIPQASRSLQPFHTLLKIILESLPDFQHKTNPNHWAWNAAFRSKFVSFEGYLRISVRFNSEYKEYSFHHSPLNFFLLGSEQRGLAHIFDKNFKPFQ